MIKNYTYTKQFYIASYNTNNKAEASLQTILQFFQETAWEHAEALGFGFSELLKKDLIWVLSRQKLKIERFPKWQEKISVTTSAVGKYKYFWFRDFHIYNEENKELLKASSSWIIINTKTRHPCRDDDLLSFNSLEKEEDYKERPSKLQGVISKNIMYEKKVAYSDIDLNNHVNNVKYIEWILDSYPIEFLNEHQIDTAELNYSSETFLGEKIRVFSDLNEHSHLHSIKNSHDKELFRAKIMWK